MEGAPDFLPYASHHLSMIIGRTILQDLELTVEEISHRNFSVVRAALSNNNNHYYSFAIESLSDSLRVCYGDRRVSLQQLAATFRRGDLLEMLVVDAYEPALA